MKRALLFALVFAMCLSVFAGTLSGDVIEKYYEYGYKYSDSSRCTGVNSWYFGYYTDEFGDETDETYLSYIGKGSYTTETSVDSSTFYYIITDDSEGISFYLLSSFGSNLASNSIKGTFEIAYKVDSTTTRASGVFGTKKAVFTETSASDSFRKALESGKDFKVLITQDGTVFESKKFNLGTIGNSNYKTAWDKAYCYTIKYDTNGGKGSIATDKVMKGEKATVNAGSSLSKDRFELIRWNTSLDGKGKSYKLGEEIIPNSNLTLYAQWRQLEFNISYNSNGGSGIVNPQIKHRGESVTLSQGEALTKACYELVGWNTQANGKGVSYKLGDTYSIDKDIVLYAQWEPKRGPTGGYIFYDCDADNDSGNADGLISTECGWRYLEVAPSDLEEKYGFDSFRYMGVVTATSIGTGKSNTEALVKAMGDTGKVVYAAKACDTYSIEVNGITYDNWFLPSKDELNLMYKNLHKNGFGAFKNDLYWSSSEIRYNSAWGQNFDSGHRTDSARFCDFYVLPIRAF